jgi:hypothetical protein
MIIAEVGKGLDPTLVRAFVSIVPELKMIITKYPDEQIGQ